MRLKSPFVVRGRHSKGVGLFPFLMAATVLTTAMMYAVWRLNVRVQYSQESPIEKIILNSYVNYALVGLRNRLCFTTDANYDRTNISCDPNQFSSSANGARNTGRMLFNEQSLLAFCDVNFANYSGNSTSSKKRRCYENAPLKEITLSVNRPYEAFSSGSHELHETLPWSDVQNLKIKLTRLDQKENSGLHASSKEAYIQVEVELQRSEQGSTRNVKSSALFLLYPRSLNYFSLVLAGDLSVASTSSFAAARNPDPQTPPRVTHLKTTLQPPVESPSPEVNFHSPVFINGDIKMDSTGHSIHEFSEVFLSGNAYKSSGAFKPRSATPESWGDLSIPARLEKLIPDMEDPALTLWSGQTPASTEPTEFLECAVDAADKSLPLGKLECWGSNKHLGSTGVLPTSFFRAVPGGVALGLKGGCGILEDKSLQCWGSPGLPSPDFRSGIQQVTSSHSFMCAVKEDRSFDPWKYSVKCWGTNAPTVPENISVRQIAVGANTLCVILRKAVNDPEDKTVRCWTGTSDYTPFDDKKVTQIQVDFYGKSCAVEESLGTLICEDESLLRDGTPTNKVTSFSLGKGVGCAIMLEDNKVKCWGNNPPTNLFNKFAQIAFVDNNNSICGITLDTSLPVCFGSAFSGSFTPPSSGTFKSLALGGRYFSEAGVVYEDINACAVGGSESVDRPNWRNFVYEKEGIKKDVFTGLFKDPRQRPDIDYLELNEGVESKVYSRSLPVSGGASYDYKIDVGVSGPNFIRGLEISIPVKAKAVTIAPFTVSDSSPITSSPIASSYSSSCVIQESGRLRCWGEPSHISGPNGSLKTYVAVAGENYNFCALRSSGVVDCWGNGIVPPSDNTDFAALTGGWHHFCALKTNGSVKCWAVTGYSSSAVTDAPTGSENADFVQITGSRSVHACALKSNGSIRCWGTSSEKTFGTTPIPAIPSAQGSYYTQVSAGKDNVCALTDRGYIKCWGDLSDPNSQGSGGYKSVSSGAGYACSIDSNNVLDCWGRGVIANQEFPGSYEHIYSSWYHLCAVTLGEDRSVHCWEVYSGTHARSNSAEKALVTWEALMENSRGGSVTQSLMNDRFTVKGKYKSARLPDILQANIVSLEITDSSTSVDLDLENYNLKIKVFDGSYYDSSPSSSPVTPYTSARDFVNLNLSFSHNSFHSWAVVGQGEAWFEKGLRYPVNAPGVDGDEAISLGLKDSQMVMKLSGNDHTGFNWTSLTETDLGFDPEDNIQESPLGVSGLSCDVFQEVRVIEMEQSCEDLSFYTDEQRASNTLFSLWGESFVAEYASAWSFYDARCGNEMACGATGDITFSTGPKNSQTPFYVHAKVDNDHTCIIKKSINAADNSAEATFYGYLACPKVEIQGSGLINIIGSIITKKLVVPEGVKLNFYNVFHPTAVDILRKHFLRSPDNSQSCKEALDDLAQTGDSYLDGVNPVFLTSNKILFDKCSTNNSRDQVEPFGWTSFTPDCKLNSSESSTQPNRQRVCKFQPVNFIIKKID